MPDLEPDDERERTTVAFRMLVERVETVWPALRDPRHRDHEPAPHAGRRLRIAAEAARATLDNLDPAPSEPLSDERVTIESIHETIRAKFQGEQAESLIALVDLAWIAGRQVSPASPEPLRGQIEDRYKAALERLIAKIEDAERTEYGDDYEAEIAIALAEARSILSSHPDPDEDEMGPGFDFLDRPDPAGDDE